MISLITDLEGRIFRFYPVAVLYDLSVTGGSVLHFIAFALLSCVPPAFFTILLAKSYSRINSAMNAVKINHRVHGEFTQGTQRGKNIHGPFYALYVRELRLFGSSPVYMLNAGIGAVLLIVAAVSFLLTDMSAIEASVGMPWFLSRTSFAFPFFPAIFVAMTSSASAGISLEGKTRWIISSLPVKTGRIFAAKIALNLTIMVPAILIAAPFFIRALSLTGMSLAFVFITPLLYAVLTTVLGLAINLRFPKYDWTTEQQAVKQSASIILSMLAGLAVTLVPMFLSYFFPRYAEIILILATVIAALGAVLLYRRISSRRYYGFT
jgi:ABC-2 type transport system permease protein